MVLLGSSQGCAGFRKEGCWSETCPLRCKGCDGTAWSILGKADPKGSISMLLMKQQEQRWGELEEGQGR